MSLRPADDDLLAALAPGAAVERGLQDNGYKLFLRVGADDAPLYLQSWRNLQAEPGKQYLIEVDDQDCYSGYFYVDDFAELMDTLARWAPAVQAAAITALITLVEDIDLSSYGLIEVIAAKARYGASLGYDELLRDRRRRAAASTEHTRRNAGGD